MTRRQFAKRRRSPGQAMLWPPRPHDRPWCYACRCVMRATIAEHAATRQHRDAIRPAEHRHIADAPPPWRRGLRDDDTGSDRANRAAARRLGIPYDPAAWS